eukprot:gnl/MRDRNA2_/MRDRNA2_59433_c0_seq1.p1 gnl/MRDRNA2_/MRDRNA2_59433_c0~~gnl/MRDRNA2_/MRDRNA2_59433_c0_seq1.p1  ORF type:complete len:795 (-),score=244.52 gnl/MRDRNA2_/MRDRNA2_59433_c0_seq1:58-2442(-)
MGRGGGGKGDKQGAYFASIQREKQDTVRWSHAHGGLPLTVRNEESLTGIMFACSLGKHKALDVILEFVRRCRDKSAKKDALDAVDEDGRTAAMWAARAGSAQCVEMLKDAGADFNIVDREGKTARQHAMQCKDEKTRKLVVDQIDGKDETDDEPDSAAESEGGFEGETSTQRSRRKKRELLGQSAAPKASTGSKSQDDVKVSESCPTPILTEVVSALASKSCELTLTWSDDMVGLTKGYLDPALWHCNALNRLQISWPHLASDALEKVGMLNKLQTLIVKDSHLVSLPSSLAQLRNLKSIEVDNNNLESLPSAFAALQDLESLSASRNALSELEALGDLKNLVSLVVDYNKLKDIEDLDLSSKSRLVTLSVSNNLLVELPDSIGELQAMECLNVSFNKIKELPCELGQLKEKKLTTLLLNDNPWKDGKIRNMIENSAVLSKDVLTYVRKQRPQGRGKARSKAKGKKGVKNESESEAEDEQPRKGKQCPKGHTLLKEAAEDLCCDGCEVDIPDGAAAFYCEACDYSLCQLCYASTAPLKSQASVKSEAEKEAEKKRAEEEAEAKAKAKEERLAAQKKAEQKGKEKAEAQAAAKALAEEQHKEREKIKAQKNVKAEEEAAVERERLERMTPEEREQEEADLAAKKANREAELAEISEANRAQAEMQAKKNENKAAQLAVAFDETKFKFVYHHGKVHKVRVDAGPNEQKKGGGGYPVQQKSKDNKKELDGTIDVPTDMIGRLIGKKGATVKAVCQETGAFIDFPKNTHGETTTVTVRGSAEAVNKAIAKISQLLGQE